MSRAALARLLNRIRLAFPEGRPLPDDVWLRRHRGIVVLLWLHVIGIACFGTLAGYGLVHSSTEAALVACCGLLAASAKFARKLRATVASLGLITSSAILVHLSGGYIEFHFHFFVMVAVIALYQDWVPFLLTIGYVVVQHGVMGALEPASVYNHPDGWANPWKWAAIHGLFILGMSAASIVAWRLNEAARADTELVLTSVGEGICGVDLRGKITLVNPAAAAMLGQDLDTLRGRPVHDVLHNPGPGEAEPSHHDCPIDATLKEGAVNQVLTATFRRGDGTNFPVEYVSAPLWRHGQIAGAVITFKDITERNQADEALRESEAGFRLMFANNPLPMWVYDLNTLRFLEVNEAAIGRYGHSREEFLRMDITDIRTQEDVPRLLGALALSHRPDLESSENWRHRLKDGQVIDVRIKSHTLTFAGRRAALVVAEDITERKRAEEALKQAKEELELRVHGRTVELTRANKQLQHELAERGRAEEALRQAKSEAEQASRAKSEFLSRMSHELRTPLNAILGFGQLLEMGNLAPADRQRAGHILKAGRHLLALINEVLEITRIEAGRLDLSPEPVSLLELMQECLDLVRPMAEERDLRLRTGVSAQHDWYVLADRQRLKQVLLNLLSNAIKYNREGGSVSLACEEVGRPQEGRGGSRTAPTGGHVRIWVSDTGPGIPADSLERLFIPFERLGADQTGIEGTGLGLALSKRLVDAMGGAIGVKSALGDGSTFWVDLPLTESPSERLERERSGPLAAAMLPQQARSVLYIEDNLSNIKLVEDILEYRPEIRLIPTMQGGLGLQLAREHNPDLILLDVHLPDMTGTQVLRRLREDPATCSIPVVVISADATPKQMDRLLAQGASKYLTKPLDVKQFLKVLQETLKGEDC